MSVRAYLRGAAMTAATEQASILFTHKAMPIAEQLTLYEQAEYRQVHAVGWARMKPVGGRG